MRVIIQRVSHAEVGVGGKSIAKIARGLLIFVGVEESDCVDDANYLAQKIGNLRIFSDAAGKMNCNVTEADGQCLVVSQFTLHAQTKKGNRPSFIRAARPEVAIPLYTAFVDALQGMLSEPVQTGVFGADMQVALTNDGPVTIGMDSKRIE